MSVASPCVKICTLDRAARLCTACHRTLDEIGRWSVMSETEQRAVLARIRADQAAQTER